MRYHYSHQQNYHAALVQVWRLAREAKGTTPTQAWEQAANTLYAFVLMFSHNKARHADCWLLYRMAKDHAESSIIKMRVAA